MKSRYRRFCALRGAGGIIPYVLFRILFATALLAAQDTGGVGSIQGVLLNGGPGVQVCAGARCADTGEGGRFLIVDVRAGRVRLTANGQDIGEAEARAGLETRIEVEMPKVDAVRSEITVTESAFVTPEEVKNSNYLVSRRDISKTAGSLQDVSRYVQTLPGVAIGSNDFRNDMIVRGGSPLENLFIVDNVEIPNINNFANFASAGGTISILDSELIRDVNFMTGGYPSQFTNRLSGVLQIAQREGSREKLSGRATVGYAGAGVILEGPINKGKGSWVTSARRSFLDLVTEDIGFGGVPVNYSFNTKALYDLSARDRIWVVNFTGIDNIRLGPTAKRKPDNELATLDIRYEGWRAATGFNWQRLIGDRAVGLLGFTHSDASVTTRVKDLIRFGTTGANVDDLIAHSPLVYSEDNREAETTLKYDLTAHAPVFDKIQAGGSFKMFRIRYDASQPLGNDNPFTVSRNVDTFAINQRFNAFQGAGYFQSSRNIGSRLNFTWGGRVDNYEYLSATRFSPRAGLSVRLTDRLSWRTSYGTYYQQPFFLFLAAFPVNRGLAPIRSDHYITGFTLTPSATLRMTLEAYRKDYSAYPVAIFYPTFSLANAGDTFAVRNLLFPMVSAGRGQSRGVEFFLEKRFSDKWFGQANLAFQRTRHAGLDGVLRPGSFDYPFLFNAVGGYRLTSKWELSTRISYLGGRPYTPFDERLSTEQRRGIFDLSRVNGVRAPDYFRLDFRLDRTFTVRDKPLLVWLGVQNVTNRKNFAEASWNREANRLRIGDQLGLFPLVGMDWRF